MIRYISDLDDPQKVSEDPAAQQAVQMLGVDYVKQRLRAHGFPESPPAQDRGPDGAKQSPKTSPER